MPEPGGRCPECGFDPSRVSPADAAVAARSYRRRFRALLVRPDDEDPEIVHRRPAGGLSAAEHALAATAGLDAAATALSRVRVADGPTVDLTPAETASPLPLEAVLDQVAAAAGSLAGTIEAMHGEEWRRTGRLPDGAEVTAVDVARAGVHAGVHHLRAAERTLSAVR